MPLVQNSQLSFYGAGEQECSTCKETLQEGVTVAVGLTEYANH